MTTSLDKITSVIEATSEIVSPVWAVGGCVRDALLGSEPKDYDLTTPLDPDAIEAMVRAAGRKPYLVGKRFGTVGFKLPLPNTDPTQYLYLEVTTFRTEAYEAGSRKPLVEFTPSLEEDLSRRDFTINAMAFDGKEVVDLFGGQADLEAKVIRAVGNPVERLEEDPLRILRAARFAARLGFSIDPKLAGAMLSKRVCLATVSRERWTEELDKLLVAPYVGAGLDALKDSCVLRLILPEVACFANLGGGALWDGLLAHVAEVQPTPEARWAALLAGAGMATGAQTPDEIVAISKEVAERTGLGLRWSKQRIADVLSLIETEL